MNKTIYLAGAMKGLTWEDANRWRVQFALKMPKHIQTLSPIRGKLEETDRGDIIPNSIESSSIHSSVGINVRDYNDVRTCDLVVANLQGMHDKSVGTIMEIAWTRVFSKPCILILPEEDGGWSDHPMLRYGNILVKDLTEAANVAISLLSTDRQLKR